MAAPLHVDKLDKEDARYQTLEQLQAHRKQVVGSRKRGNGVM
ncbi:hypothetical protein [Chitinivorax sp. B]|nr:hypothetical protein [Chitinivorax sp. B]